jgi:ABC-type uncharacterized transport system involved in gliding motility auxiliary subunit
MAWLRKELSHFFNSFLIYALIAGGGVSVAYFLFWQNGPANLLVRGEASFSPFFALMPYVMAVLVPALGMRSWAGEHAQGTLEWLKGRAQVRSVLWAKFFAALFAWGCTLTPSLFMAALLAQRGPLDWGPVASGYLTLLLLGAVLVSLTQGFSALFLNQALAFLASFGLSFLAFFGWHARLTPGAMLQRAAAGLLHGEDVVLLVLLSLIGLLFIEGLWRWRLSGRGRDAISPVALMQVVAFLLMLGITQQLGWQWDLTREGRWSLHEQTRTLLRDLRQPVTIKLFLSGTLPNKMAPIRDYLRTFLSRVAHESNGRVSFEEVDPDRKESYRLEAESYGIKSTAANITQKQKVELVHIWFGMALLQAERQEVFPTMGDLQTLEYDLAAALNRLNQDDKPTVLLWGPMGNGALHHHPDLSLKNTAETLEKRFDLVWRDANTAQDSLPLVDAMVVWGCPIWSVAQLKQLDEALGWGIPTLLFATGVNLDAVSLEARDLPSGESDSFLKHLGLAIGRDLIADENCQTIRFTGTQSVSSQYPVFPKLVNPQWNTPEPPAPEWHVGGVTLPWTSSVKVLDEEHSWRVLFQSSPKSWRLQAPYLLTPESLAPQSATGPHVMAVWRQSQAPAFFEENHHHERKETALAVVGSHHFPSTYQNPLAGLWMTAALEHWLSFAQLSGIVRVDHLFQPLPELSPSEKAQTKQLALLLGPLLAAGLGLGWWVKRRMMNR